jgi:hypothetical protein
LSEQPPEEEPYEIPGTHAAGEPENLPEWPMTAAEATPFIRKVVA